MTSSGASSTASSALTERYAAAIDKQYVPLDDAIVLCRDLGLAMARLSPHPEIAVGLANGGILPAIVAAQAAGIPAHVVKVRRKSSRLKQRLRFIKRLFRLSPRFLAWRPVNAISFLFDKTFNQVEAAAPNLGFDVAGRHVVIVDDCVDSGSSVAHVRGQLLAAGARSVAIATMSWATKFDSQAMHGVTPDIHQHRVIHYYPWAMNNPDYAAFERWLEQAGHQLWT